MVKSGTAGFSETSVNFTRAVRCNIVKPTAHLTSPLDAQRQTANERDVTFTAKSEYWLCHVCLSVRLFVRMQQLGSHLMDFDEI